MMETQSRLEHARPAGYLEQKQYDELDEVWQHVGAMRNRMIQCAIA